MANAKSEIDTVGRAYMCEDTLYQGKEKALTYKKRGSQLVHEKTKKKASTDLGKNGVKQNRGYIVAKRVWDIVLSIIGIAICIIPAIIIMLLIVIDSPGAPIYIHRRIGKNGKPLYLLKFRTMYRDAYDMMGKFTPEQMAEWRENFKIEGDPRITRIGKFLRRSSLDELPQLLNILKGELSIVGPRPVVAEELERYGENKEKFLSVTPGLTGYWQAYARSNCTYEQRMEMELYYVDNANFWWDIKIMFATVGAVLRRHGAK
ncbi:MAG: sugar transferase [Clostridia bacterium]|nr:sugar transferase [Clostridia bacterium]